jgi:polysaccharide pyruvyl transferase WcaK-like protein
MAQPKHRPLHELLDSLPLDDSFMLGYYGGGNYGDELLFEVLQHYMIGRGYGRVSFLYQKPSAYRRFHIDLGYQSVDAGNKMAVLRALFKHRNLVVGGGGLWGLDMNTNVLLMSCMLFFARWFLGKEVYLIGVGYYGSTSRMGHIAAWLAGKAASAVLARDNETYQNFVRLNRRTFLSDDIATMLPDTKTDVSHDLQTFEETVCKVDEPMVVISLRHFKPHQSNPYTQVIEKWLMQHRDIRVILALMEPREVDTDGFLRLKEWQRKRGNAVVIDFDYNPMVLFQFFKRYHGKLRYIGPQFHVLMVAHLSGVPFLPIAYDNKVSELFKRIGQKNSIPVNKVEVEDIEKFIGSKGR